jgi:hypothetical protein
MWGTHWTMANQNPNVMNAMGQRQIASYYYPMIGPYASSDHDVIEYQLLLMKYAGLDGVLIDWPGTIKAYDYPKNLKNCEAIMALTAAVGLDFAIVYEDANVGAAASAGFVSNEIAAGQADFAYAQSTYFGQSNYIHVNGAPLLLDFGPQTFTKPSDWDQVLAPLSPRPTFVTLWYESSMAGGNASGEFAWLYMDFTTGLAATASRRRRRRRHPAGPHRRRPCRWRRRRPSPPCSSSPPSPRRSRRNSCPRAGRWRGFARARWRCD